MALVITIITMLILSGVSLNATIGENGVITKAQKSTFANKISKYDEEFEMNAVGLISEDGIERRENITLMNEYVRNLIPSLEDDDVGKYAIVKGELYYCGDKKLEKEVCTGKGYNLLPDGMTIDDFISKVESSAIEAILKNMVGNAFYEEKEDGTNGIMGVALANKVAGTFGSTQQWKIITEIENGETKAVYGTGWYFVERGSTIDGIGILKNSYIIDYTNRKAVKFNASKHTILTNGSNLAVSKNLIFNADPTNMENGSTESWGGAILYGFNGTEYNDDGTVKSGWSPTSFIFDGVDDYALLYTDSTFQSEGITIEMYGYMDNSKYTVISFTKGPANGSSASFKHSMVNSKACMLCNKFENQFRISGTYVQGIDAGEYRCSVAENDFHIPLREEFQNSDVFTTFCLKKDGEFIVYLNGKKVKEGRFNSAYVEAYNRYLSNTSYPIHIGCSYFGDERLFRNNIIYSCRVYDGILNDDEVLANYNATTSYHNILVNNGNASTGGNTGGEDIGTIE